MGYRSGTLRVALALVLSASPPLGAAGLAFAQAQSVNVVLRNFAIEGAPAAVRAGQQPRFVATNPGPQGNHTSRLTEWGHHQLPDPTWRQGRAACSRSPRRPRR